MSLHLDARQGEIAETVLLPGDPLRAKFIAEKFFENSEQYNSTRNMLGFTGTYKGKRLSVQGTGMGCASMGIYAHDLINGHGCKTLIRVGTAGSFVEDVKIGDSLLVTGASYESAFANTYELNGIFSAVASYDLLSKANIAASNLGIDFHTGTVVTTDVFYEHNPDWWKRWQSIGVLAVEMETAALYMIAQTARVNALSIVTMSDHFVTGERSSNEEREQTFTQMIKIALETAIA